MKILQVITSLQIGGAENLLKDLALYFKSKGVEVTIVVFLRVDSFIHEFLKRNKIRILHCPVSKKISLRNFFFLIDHLKHEQYDIVHTHLTWDLYMMALVKLFLKRRPIFVTTEHSTFTRRRNNLFVKLFRLERLVYKRYSKIICVTKEVCNVLEELLPSLMEKFVVINNGVDIKKFIGNYSVKLRLRTPTLLSVGSLCDRKDQFTLVRAMQFIKDAKLCLVGEGNARRELEELINRLHLRERIFLLGQSSIIDKLHQKTTIYVQPSLYEGFCISVLEAMAYGLPIVSSDIKGLHTLVKDVGMFFPVGDEKALAEIINQLLQQPKMLKQMSTKGKNKAKNFSISKTGESHFSLYKNLLEDRYV